MSQDNITLKIKNVINLSGNDFKRYQNTLVDIFYPIEEEVKICGVTGTNGKTSVVHICREISSLLGKNSISIGTLGVVNGKGEVVENLNSTTPSKLDLRRIISKFKNKCDAFFIEVSSHGLHQERMRGLKFFSAGWTSFSQDHLDYHKNIEDYFQAKMKIYEYLTPEGELFVPAAEKLLIDRISKLEPLKITGPLTKWDFVNMPSSFNVSFNKNNLELATELINSLWDIPNRLDLEQLTPPPGRLSIIKKGENLVVIDYAHTPDALKNICQAVRDEFKTFYLIVVFGCGGDRDKTKRPIMGEIAEKYGDKVILTNDNPRNEDPELIVQDIKAGMKSICQVEYDRKKAIEQALNYFTNRKKIVLIAGKGHENYQEIRGEKIRFSDFDVIK